MKLIVRFLITLSISIFIISFFSFGIQAVTDSPSISMSSSSVQQGNQVTLSVSIANMTPYSGLDVSVFYDEDNFEVSYIYYSGLYDSINHQKDVNDTNPGIINYVMITPTNTELNGTIMNIVFKAKNDALIQSHLFYIAVNNAFNQQLETISMQIENGSVLVTEKDVAIQSIYYYQSISDANLEIGDTFTWQIYSYNTYSVSASQYEFYYPRTNIKIT